MVRHLTRWGSVERRRWAGLAAITSLLPLPGRRYLPVPTPPAVASLAANQRDQVIADLLGRTDQGVASGVSGRTVAHVLFNRVHDRA